MKKIEKEYILKYEFEPSDAANAQTILEKNGVKVDDWYVYTTNDVYQKLFKTNLQNKNKLPWKRKVVKVTSKENGFTVYRIWRGVYRFIRTKDILYVDKEAKYLLSEKDEPVIIILKPSNKFCYYWNHFAPEIRVPFKISLISLLIGIISLIISIVSFVPRDIVCEGEETKTVIETEEVFSINIRENIPEEEQIDN